MPDKQYYNHYTFRLIPVPDNWKKVARVFSSFYLQIFFLFGEKMRVFVGRNAAQLHPVVSLTYLNIHQINL